MQVVPEEVLEGNDEVEELEEDLETEDEEQEEVEEEQEEEVETEAPATEITSDDTAITEALAASQKQIESLGGRFDVRGQFVGWEEVSTSRRDVEESPDFNYYGGDRDEEIDSKIGEATKELRIDKYMNNLIAENQLLKIVAPETTAMLAKLPGRELNEQVAKMVAYGILGMRTPVLLAMTQKEAKMATKNKMAEVTSASALTSSGGGARTVSTNVKVSPTIARYAKAWGLDAKKIQIGVNKLEQKSERGR